MRDLKKALELACEELDTHCPADIEEGADGICICKELYCDNNTTECWKKYFLMKARESE